MCFCALECVPRTLFTNLMDLGLEARTFCRLVQDTGTRGCASFLLVGAIGGSPKLSASCFVQYPVLFGALLPAHVHLLRIPRDVLLPEEARHVVSSIVVVGTGRRAHARGRAGKRQILDHRV